MTKQQAEMYDWGQLNRSGRIGCRRYYRQLRKFLDRQMARELIKECLFGVWIGRQGSWCDR